MTVEFHIDSGRRSKVTWPDGDVTDQAETLCGQLVPFTTTTTRERATCGRCRELTGVRWEDATRWLLRGHCGLSSETMLRCALGLPAADVNHPRDIYDFRRCLRLLDDCPWVRNEFPRIAGLSPTWAAIIEHWPVLVAAEEGGDYWWFVRTLTRASKQP